MDRARDHDDRDASLGQCPHCETVIPHERLYIQYIPKDDWPRMIAECPTCETAVAPE